MKVYYVTTIISLILSLIIWFYFYFKKKDTVIPKLFFIILSSVSGWFFFEEISSRKNIVNEYLINNGLDKNPNFQTLIDFINLDNKKILKLEELIKNQFNSIFFTTPKEQIAEIDKKLKELFVNNFKISDFKSMNFINPQWIEVFRRLVDISNNQPISQNIINNIIYLGIVFTTRNLDFIKNTAGADLLEIFKQEPNLLISDSFKYFVDKNSILFLINNDLKVLFQWTDGGFLILIGNNNTPTIFIKENIIIEIAPEYFKGNEYIPGLQFFNLSTQSSSRFFTEKTKLTQQPNLNKNINSINTLYKNIELEKNKISFLNDNSSLVFSRDNLNRNLTIKLNEKIFSINSNENTQIKAETFDGIKNKNTIINYSII